MKQDCIYWETGCGQPMFNPRNCRTYPSWCDYCQEHKPSATVEARLDDLERIGTEHIVVYEHSDISDSNLKRLTDIEADVSGLKKGYHIHSDKKKKEQDYY